METVHQRCAGIDIGKRSLTACVITTGTRGEPAKETRTFRTLTRDLLALADWLDAAGVTAVAMEATGSYWKPIWNLLEDRFELLLANAAHLKGLAPLAAKSAWNGRLLRQQDRGHPRAVEGATGSLRGADRVQRAARR